jgi:catechol 2,3-dioxygenase-like lactoylglutathione lyase family enzyme
MENGVYHQQFSTSSRRQALRYLGAGAAAWIAGGAAQASELPIKTSGLEHIGMQVPDQEATAKFYGRIFDPQLFQERDPPPRFYAKIGISYIAFGGLPANVTAARIDHFCAVVVDYKGQEMRKSLDEAAVSMTGQGGLAMAADPDGLRLQFLGVPAGLARTIIPSSRISQEEPAVQAIGFEHIMLAVSDLEKSAAHYRKIFGMEVSRTKKPERVWFGVAKTRLGLETVTAGKMPSVDHVCIKVAGFDRKTVADKLKTLGGETMPSNDENLLRFKDLNGLIMELKSGV